MGAAQWRAKGEAEQAHCERREMQGSGMDRKHPGKHHKNETVTRNAHAGSRTRVTSMGGLYDAATLHALLLSLYARVLFEAWPGSRVFFCFVAPLPAPFQQLRAKPQAARAPSSSPSAPACFALLAAVAWQARP
jgi:hypothetical protein